MKQKKIKSQKYVSEDTKQMTSLLLITLGVVIVVIGLYFLTEKVIERRSNKGAAEFDYGVATVGTMFNRPYEEYYVFLFASDSDNAQTYNSLVSSYIGKEDAKKIYTVDLSKNLDDKYLSEKSNTNPSNPSEVKINSSALILIKNGKVSKYYETLEDYEKVLK